MRTMIGRLPGLLPKQSPAIPWRLVGALSLLFVLALLSALLLGLGAWLPLGFVYGMALVAALIVAGLVSLSQGQLHVVLVTVLVLTIFQNPINQIAGPPIGYLMELICFTLLIGAAFAAWRRYGAHPAMRWMVGLMIAYFVLAIASTLLGRSHTVAALWQFQYNLKLPAMLLLGMAMTFTPAQHRSLKIFIWVAWLPIAAFVAIEALAPSSYFALMKTPVEHTINPFLGFGVRRAGPFLHSGAMAVTAAMACWIAAVHAFAKRSAWWGLPALIYLVLLVLSGQRQEALALGFCLCLLPAYVLRYQWRCAAVAMTLLVAIAVVAAVLLDFSAIQKLRDLAGAGTGLEQISERTVLSRTGVQIAKDYAPLGSGLGTYGGAGAQKFDQSQFVAYGFDKYWWFQRGLFLIDVYWPSVAAEAGFLAAALWGAALAVPLGLLVLSAMRDGFDNLLAWSALGCIVVVLANSPSSAALTDPRASFWGWLLIGAAFARAMQPHAEACAAAAQRLRVLKGELSERHA